MTEGRDEPQMKRTPKPLALILSLLLLFSVCFQTALMPRASAETLSSAIGQDITEWVLDETAGYLYAVSKDTNNLLFIRTSDLAVESTVSVGSAPTDVRLQNGKLYIPLSGTNGIAVVDLATRAVEQTLTISVAPYRVALDGDKLYYVQSDFSQVYVYNLTTGTSAQATSGNSYYKADLAVDSALHLLYVGDSSLSGSNIALLRTTDSAKVSVSTYDEGYGFSSPSRKVITAGGTVFYAGRQLDGSNLAVINGDYTEQLLSVQGQYVLTGTGVYDRDRFVKIALLPFTASQAVMDSTGNVYAFNASTQTLQKTQLDLSLKASSYQPLGSKLVLDKKLTDWVLDDANGYLYAVSAESNRLLFIRTSDMTVDSELYIGSKPSDIELSGGKLYVALGGATKMVVVDPATKTVETTDITLATASKLAMDGTTAFYVPNTNSAAFYPYQHDFATGAGKKLSTSSLAAPDIAVDPAAHLVYFGESNSSGSDLIAYRTNDFAQVSQTNYGGNYGFSYPQRKVIADGGSVYYAGYQFPGGNLPVLNGYYNSYILAVKGNYVLTRNAVFDRDKFVSVATLPVQAALAALDNAGNTYVYEDETKTVHKLQLDLSLKTSAYQYQANKIVMDKKLAGWVLDEPNGYLYAISQDSNRLLFIRLSDFTVESELYVGSEPTDLKLADGKLYIPLNRTTSIAVVDLATKSVEKRLAVPAVPSRVAVDGAKLYYVTSDTSSTYLNTYNLATNALAKLTALGSLYSPDMTVDSAAHTLYVGESNTSSAKLFSVRTTDDAKLQQSSANDGANFNAPSRKVILDDGNLYYAGQQIETGSLSVLNGDYKDQLISLSGSSVLSKTSVYDRDTFVKLGALPVTATLAVTDTAGNTYLYEDSTKTIHKTLLNLTMKKSTYTKTGNKLALDKKLIDWVYDETTDYVYAISNETNRLLYINASTLNVDKEILVGSAPSDVDLVNGKLYVALSGATKLAVYDAATGTLANTYVLNHNPYRVEAGTDKLYTVGYSQYQYLRTYDPLTGAATKGTTSYYYPELLLDDASGKLHVADTGSSSSKVTALRSTDFSQVDKWGSSVYNAPRWMVKDGNDLYFAKYRFNAAALATAATTYPANVIFAKGNKVFAPTAVYDRDSAAKTASLPYTAALVAVRGDGSFLAYSSTSNAIFSETAPSVVTVSPADGETSFPVDKGMFVTFSSTVSAGSAYNSIELRDAAGNLVPLTHSLSASTLTLTPNAALANGTVYTLTLPAGVVQSATGVASTQPTTVTFTTVPSDTPPPKDPATL
jgi:hypothetical protein